MPGSSEILVPKYQTARRQKIVMLTVKSVYDGVSRALNFSDTAGTVSAVIVGSGR
jgi:hypothetical protein